MRVVIHTNIVDQSTSKVEKVLHPALVTLGNELSGDYGGIMEHLWIDLELVEAFAKPDGGPRHQFRFQKRVSGHTRLGLPAVPDSYNVGHYSVRPDFESIRSLPSDQVVGYTISLIYRSTEVLFAKSKKLGGFDAEQFRQRFRGICQNLGLSV